MIEGAGGYSEILEGTWRELDEGPRPSEEQIAVLTPDQITRNLGIRAGLDQLGRHLLVEASETEYAATSEDLRGKSVQLKKRWHLVDGETLQFVDIVCLDPALNAVFSAFCSDFVATVLDRPEIAPSRIAAKHFGEWRELFALGRRPLGKKELAGLFGELLILERLVAAEADDVLDAWTGPDHGIHDFASGADSIEVKSTLSPSEQTIHVHGLDQLEPVQDGHLALAFMRLTPAEDGKGRNVNELVSAIAETVSRDGLIKKLRGVGYQVELEESYRDHRFDLVSEVWYAIDDQFSRLRRQSLVDGNLPNWATHLEYVLDLGISAPHAMSDADVALHMSRLAST